MKTYFKCWGIVPFSRWLRTITPMAHDRIELEVACDEGILPQFV